MKNNKSITDLIIELNKVNETIDKIKNDPEYINERVNQIYGGKTYTTAAKEAISALFKEVQ